MNPKEIYYENVSKTIIQNLKKRQMEGYYCKSSQDALLFVSSLLPPKSTVSFGGSMTLEETGILKALRENQGLTLLDRSTATTPEEVKNIYEKAFSCDSYLMSTNAITLDGELVNIDGNGNRVAALIWGPKQVIVVVGMNKITSDLQDAYHRIKNIASPKNCVRLNRNTPCSTTGKCGNCYASDSICSQTVITRRSHTPGRIKVILVGEELGY